jgi:hypothetical protein
MCVVSAVGDNWRDRLPETYPWINPNPQPGQTIILSPPISRQEFDKLKAEVEELKKLLKAAKEFDEKTGQPDCEMDDKVNLIKRVAELVGVDMKDVFK